MLENNSLGCVKCSEEMKLKKVSMVDEKENFMGGEIATVLSGKEN